MIETEVVEHGVAMPPPPSAIFEILDVAATLLDPQRLEAVQHSGLLDAPSEPAFDRLTRLAVRLLDVPTAFFSLVDETRDFYVSACGIGDVLGAGRELTGVSFCHYAIHARVPLVIQILAPNHRPIQITQNLATFWKDSYPKIKQELQRKYPRHEWR